MEPQTPWYIASVVFFIIGTIAALGEWVFHWWEDPGQYVAVGSYAITLYTFLTGTSRGFIRGENLRLHRRFDRLEGGQDRLHLGQQDLVRGQQDLVRGQQDLVRGQQELVQGQREFIRGQQEQTSLLQRLVESFRGR